MPKKNPEPKPEATPNPRMVAMFDALSLVDDAFKRSLLDHMQPLNVNGDRKLEKHELLAGYTKLAKLEATNDDIKDRLCKTSGGLAPTEEAYAPILLRTEQTYLSTNLAREAFPDGVALPTLGDIKPLVQAHLAKMKTCGKKL